MAKRFRVPRFDFAKGKTFLRDKFLDGTYSTYFAPGQKPGVLAKYKPPKQWRPANSILSPPQVVWLDLAQADTDQPTYGRAYLYQTLLYNSFASPSDQTLIGQYNNSLYHGGPEPPPEDLLPIYMTTQKVLNQWTDGTNTTFTTTTTPSSGWISWLQTPATHEVGPALDVWVPIRPELPVGTITGTVVTDYTVNPPYVLKATQEDADNSTLNGTTIVNGNYTARLVTPALNPTGLGGDQGLSSVTPDPAAWYQIVNAITTKVPASIPNPYFDEYPKLLSSFQEAADTINALRKGKTWVYVWDYTAIATKKNWLMLKTFPRNRPWFAPMLVPLPASKPYFGIDFLHVLTGCPFSFNGNPSQGGMYTPRTPNFSGVPAASRKFIVGFWERMVRKAFGSFFRHAVRLYGFGGWAPDIPPFTVIDVRPLIAAAWPGNVLNALHGSGAGVPPTPTPTAASVGLYISHFLNEGNYNNHLSMQTLAKVPNLCDSQFKGFASDLKKFGYRYGGPESKLFNSVDVVNLIAKHFGFDPETGIDAPLPSNEPPPQ